MKHLAKSILAHCGITVSRRRGAVGWGGDAFVDQQRLLARSGVRTIFDVGANLGQTTERYLELFPDAQIHAFEPTPSTYESLKDHFASNLRVKTHRLAVARTTSVLELQLNSFHATNSLLQTDARCGDFIDANLVETLTSVAVQATSIDDFIQGNGIEHVDILKMDIQGAEGYAVDGAEMSLRQRKIGLIYTEVLFANLYQSQCSFAELTAKLERLGYRLFSLYDLKVMPAGLAWADAIYVQAS